MEFGLKYDLRAPAFGSPAVDLYAAALSQCKWADDLGFHSVRFMEHHGSDDGYCPSPLIVAAAVAALTSTLGIRIQALILPLHDPIRVAEDCTVIDLISRGRLELVVAGGYVEAEYAMFGKLLIDRPQLVEEGVQALRQAWTGEPFELHSRPVRVALLPHRRSGPPIYLGGSSKAAARRAARIADGFQPGPPGLVEVYRDECGRLGKPVGWTPPPSPVSRFIHIAEDTEAAWRTLGPHLLHESSSYGRWISEAGTAGVFQEVADLAELRGTGTYQIVNPEQFVDLARRLGPAGRIEFHPLVGGVDPEVGWTSLRLFEEAVRPVLIQEGLL